MTWPTHALFGVSSLWLLALLPPQWLGCDWGTLAALAAFGALLPDLDASESKIKHLKILNTQFKPFMLPALVVHRSDQHRGLLHSLAGVGLMLAFCAPIIGRVRWFLAVALLLGYLSHLVADSATKSGISWFYPSPRKFYLLPRAWQFTTGSLAEETLMAPLAVTVLSLLLTKLGT